MSELIGAIRITGTSRERNEIGRFTAAVKRGATNAALAVANLGAAVAQAAAPVRSGRLAGSIYSSRLGPYSAIVGATAPWAAVQNFGGAAHEIGAPGQTLANKEQNFGPTKGPVHHPGNPATRFMDEAYAAAAAEGENIIARYMPES